MRKKKAKKNEDYIRFFQVYIYRKVFYVLLILLLCIPIVIFKKDLFLLWNKLTNQDVNVTVFYYNDLELAKFQGNVEILNKQGKRIYQGMFKDGACNGKGTLYDEHGHKVYTGEFIDNVMEDKSGTLYFEDKGDMKKYVGTVKQNVANGKGNAYRKIDGTYSLMYEGDFVDGTFEGKGIAYDVDGNIEYEGEYLDGLRHGQGILYEDGKTTRKVYQGEFAFGKPQGIGTLYDTFGKVYYKGNMYNGYINYTSFLPSTLKEVEESFMLPYDIYVYENTTAIVYKSDLLSIVFFTKYPLDIEKTDKEWKLKDDIKPDDIVFSSILMVDNNIDDPSTGIDAKKIEASWQAKYRPHTETKIMDAYDIIALQMTRNKDFQEYQECTSIVDHKHNIYEISYHLIPDLTKRVLYPVTDLSIGYGYPIYQDKLLYTIMVKEDAKTLKESEKIIK